MIDLEELKPCRECGKKCPTQAESIHLNGGVPWSTCDACYDRIPTVGDAQDTGSPKE